MARDAQIVARLARLSSPHPVVRARALRWLQRRAPGALGREEAATLWDPAPSVRAAAAVAFRASADPVLAECARAALRDLLTSDVAATRHAGLRAAAALANPFLAPRLLPFLAHPAPATRRLALLALAALPHDLGLFTPVLVREPALALLDDPDGGVRDAADRLIRKTSAGISPARATHDPKVFGLGTNQ